MDVLKRSRYASQQMRAGPAPLASFEDLPSDELESPEDFPRSKEYICNIDDESSTDLQLTTPDSLTVSSQSTPRIERDFDSHYTLTPGGDSYQGQSTCDLRTASLSSLSKDDSTTYSVSQQKGSAVSLEDSSTFSVGQKKGSAVSLEDSTTFSVSQKKGSVVSLEDSLTLSVGPNKGSAVSLEDSNTLSVNQKKGSAASLGTFDGSEVEYTHRKSSWTDIFKSHNQNSAKTSTPVVSPLEPCEKSSKKKSKTHSSKKDSDAKSKEKKKFLSLFKKKSNKQVKSPISPDYILPTESLNVEQSCDLPPKTLAELPLKLSNGSVSKGKENESPIDNQTTPVEKVEIQNDLGKSNSDYCDTIPDERKLNRKVINVSESTVDREFNIVLKQVEEKVIDETPVTEDIQATDVIKEEHESSESDLTLGSKSLPIEKKEDDFEAETLLPHDLSELEDEPVSELQPVTFEISSINIPSRQQRLEITTKPIDRPRSTTPINVAPLEAFIQSISPTFDSKVDKIKLSLPGEQFVVSQKKSPKKSSMKSWADFCERGLHSPRMHKRIDRNSSKSMFDASEGAFTTNKVQISSDNWAAFESDFTTIETNVFSDNFESDFGMDIASTELPKMASDPYQYFESNFNFSSCSSNVDVFDCSCLKMNDIDLFDAQSSTQPISFTHCLETCSCQCHSKQKSSINASEPCSNIDTFGASNLFGMVTDEQY